MWERQGSIMTVKQVGFCHVGKINDRFASFQKVLFLFYYKLLLCPTSLCGVSDGKENFNACLINSSSVRNKTPGKQLVRGATCNQADLAPHGLNLPP